MLELQEGEEEKLLAAKAAVEANWKTTKWLLIATKLEELTGNKYPSEFLLKSWKKMEVEKKEEAAGEGDGEQEGEGEKTGKGGAGMKGGNALLDAAVLAMGDEDEEEEDEEEDGEEE
ncbi:MAG: hypothetical protein Q9220_003822 [cf. Caloplaca sp. 1 TL-2023]